MPSNFQDDDTKTRKARGFDPTKANVNGRSIDDYEYRDENVRKADDDSRRSSYETNQIRRGSVQGGYRQPIPPTNLQQYPSRDGLASSATDVASTLKDSGYSDVPSRNQTPEDYLGTGSSTEYDSSSQLHRPRELQRPMLGKRHQQGELLKTIVDDYDQPPTEGYQQRLYREQRDDYDPNRAGALGPEQRPLRDKPSMLSPEYIESQDR